MPRSSVYSGPKFLLPSPNKQTSKKAAESDFLPSSSKPIVNPSLPWDEKYTPTTESELAVRVQKLDEIKYYINSSAISQSQGQYKILVLTGPTGVGKSTAIRVVARSMGYDLIEWKNQQQHNPQSGHFDPDYEPTMEKFSRFLHRSINTATLTTEQQKPRIILLDDIPDLTTPYIKQKFQSLLKAYIESNCAFLIVLVHSVAQMATELGRKRFSSWETQLTKLHDLVTTDLRLTGRCGTIEFNPIIKANLRKVLSHILACEAKFSKRPSITQQQLEFIIESCHGDIRSAILTMQFYSINPYPNSKKRRRTGDSVHTSSISSRENPFDFFHAVGKVIYAKRLPSGLLESKPCNILGNTHIDTDKYLGYIYSNHAYMMDDIHDVANSMDYLCEADMLSGMGAWNVILYPKKKGRLDLYCFLLLLFALGRCTTGVSITHINVWSYGS
ncbi:Rad17 cell cycle checkpoint protein-domain-containing protein [Absidia repens]|uniref:Rad17 cell cycle checkpoint protein-domain-containing protein n=1 Tax=Absidia repens TaxID=90262 RepID=A0A1X2I5N8_9FUNG|nr:Rad17 cell cycle checkpoint protein-domain-containing protein [Absidia repens]